MRGELVVVRAFGGQPLVRRVWAADASTVYICGEQEFQRRLSGDETVWPVGFPREDVFIYDPSLAALLTESLAATSWGGWEQLKPWGRDSA